MKEPIPGKLLHRKEVAVKSRYLYYEPMENKASFFERLDPRLAPSEALKVRVAYYLAKYGHRAQTRKELDATGKPLRYFEHLRRVALILMDEADVWDPDMICTALLHDSLEDTKDLDATILEHLFGAQVSRRVRLLSKVPKEGYLERLTKAADDQTILLKACDRLDNLRSLDQTTPEFRQKQIKETVEKYLPLFTERLHDHAIVKKIIFAVGRNV